MTFEEWMRWRARGIGSSDAAAVMGVSPWSSPFELFLEKTGRIKSRVRKYWELKAMWRGLRLEPEARMAYQKETGIRMPPKRLESRTHSALRANFDGFNGIEERVGEFKVPGKKDHSLALEKQIPEKYIWQLVHLLLVARSHIPWLDSVDYYSYRDKKGELVVMPRNTEREELYLTRADRFWWCVERDDPRELYFPGNHAGGGEEDRG